MEQLEQVIENAIRTELFYDKPLNDDLLLFEDLGIDSISSLDLFYRIKMDLNHEEFKVETLAQKVLAAAAEAKGIEFEDYEKLAEQVGAELTLAHLKTALKRMVVG